MNGRVVNRTTHRDRYVHEKIFLVSAIAVTLAILTSIISRLFQNAQRRHCQENLKQLTVAVNNYRANHKDNLPNISYPKAIQVLLTSYGNVTGKPIDTCPEDGAAYQGNPALYKLSFKQIADPANTILFYENDNAHLDGCNVAFVDGHVKWYRNAKWQKMKQVARVP